MGKRLAVGGLVAAVLAIVLVPRTADAQVSVWLQKGVSGVGADLGVFVNEDNTEVVLAGGYSYRGFLDLDLGLHFLTFEEDNPIAPDLTAVGLTPSLQFHPLKQGPAMPLSLGLGLTIGALAFASEEIEARGLEVTGVTVGATAAVYRFVRLAPRIGVIPAVGVQFSYSEISVSDSEGEELDSSDDNSVAATITAKFAYIDSRGFIYGLAPSVVIGDSVSYGITASFIWPFGTRPDDPPVANPAPVATR